MTNDSATAAIPWHGHGGRMACCMLQYIDPMLGLLTLVSPCGKWNPCSEASCLIAQGLSLLSNGRKYMDKNMAGGMRTTATCQCIAGGSSRTFLVRRWHTARSQLDRKSPPLRKNGMPNQIRCMCAWIRPATGLADLDVEEDARVFHLHDCRTPLSQMVTAVCESVPIIQ